MGNNHSNFSKNAWKSCVCKYMLSICINLEHHVWHQPVYMTRFLNQWIMVLCLCDHDFGLYCIYILATHYSPLMSFEGKTPHLPRDVKHKKINADVEICIGNAFFMKDYQSTAFIIRNLPYPNNWPILIHLFNRV